MRKRMEQAQYFMSPTRHGEKDLIGEPSIS